MDLPKIKKFKKIKYIYRKMVDRIVNYKRKYVCSLTFCTFQNVCVKEIETVLPPLNRGVTPPMPAILKPLI